MSTADFPDEDSLCEQVPLTLTIAAPVAGLLIFESLVWLGVRQVKFANPGPAGHARPAAAAP